MADFDTPRLVDGPDTAPATVLLAHGAGAPMDSPFMAAMASGLADQSWRVVRFEFAYMARQRLSGRKAAPDRLPKLQEVFRQQVALEASLVPCTLSHSSLCRPRSTSSFSCLTCPRVLTPPPRRR